MDGVSPPRQAISIPCMPVLVTRPSDAQLEVFRTSQCASDFSYAPAGMTRTGEAPSEYSVDHYRVRLGQGMQSFQRAQEAIGQWVMFDMGWTTVWRPRSPAEPGLTVAVLVRAFGLWWLNACRVVYTFDDELPVRRYGFAYGTLSEHAESGEERFTVEWDPATDEVWYDLLAISRPNKLLVKTARPLARSLQRRFARDSQRAMVKFCEIV